MQRSSLERARTRAHTASVWCDVWCVCSVGISFRLDSDDLLSAEPALLNFAKLDWSTPGKDAGNRG